MRVLIAGAGGLGTVLAGFLARSVADVTLLVKPEQKRQFERPEVHVGGVVDFVAPVRVLSDPSDLSAYDFGIFCVKARDTEAVLAALEGTRFGAVLSLQNGVRKDELLIERFGAERVLGGLTYLAGALQQPGRADASNPAATFIGELDGRPSDRGEQLTAALRSAGLPAETVANVVTLGWYKLAIFLRTALVSALTRLDVATLAGDASLRRLCAAIAREVTVVAAAEGHELPREASTQFSLAGPAPRDRSPAAAGADEAEFDTTLAELGKTLRRDGRSFYPSLAQDVIAGRPTELEATAGDVLERAIRHSLTLPVLASCTDLLRGIERAVRA